MEHSASSIASVSYRESSASPSRTAGPRAHLLPLKIPGSSAGPTPGGSILLAAQARQGSAAALRDLTARCLHGPIAGRLEALRLLPGLVPIQPVWPILDRADRLGQPRLVRAEVLRLRENLEAPQEFGPVYRAAQGALVEDFVRAEDQRLQARRRRRAGLLLTAGRPARPQPLTQAGASAPRMYQLRWARGILTGFFLYRFEHADGCIGGVEERHVSEYLLQYAPRQLLLEADGQKLAPSVLSRYLLWLGERGWLLRRDARRLCLYSLALRSRYQDELLHAQPGSPRALLHEARDFAGDDVLLRDRYLALRGLDLEVEFLPLFVT